MDIYWYAPFNNADELDVAQHVPTGADSFVVQSLASRFGQLLPSEASGKFDLIRDLPEPAGEDGRRALRSRRLAVAATRALRRERFVRSRRFDLLHIHTFNMFTDWAALPALRRHAPLMVGTVHNVLPHDRRGPADVERWLHRTGYRAFDHLFVAHRHLCEMLVAEFSLPRERISVLPLPITPTSELNQAHLAHVREFLFFGTLRHNKGIPVLLDAISQVKDPDVRFRFAGRGPEDLENLVRSAARRDDRIVAEVGFVTSDRKADLLRSAWAVVLPYTAFDAQSGVLQDAYAYGLPVVATSVGALGSAVSDEGSGWTVEPGDPDALAQCITRVLSADTERAAAAAQIKKIAIQRTPERIGALLRETYSSIEPHRSGGRLR